MKPSPWAEAAFAAVILAASPVLAQPAGFGPVAQPAGFGPVALRMPRATAIAAAGPAALVGPLCGGAEGVLFPTPAGEAMAMFEDGQVSEMALTPDGDGAERTREDCAAVARTALAGLPSRRSLPAARHAVRENAGIVEEVLRVASPRGELGAISRWSARSGACYVTLHWLAPGATSRILPD